MFPVEMQAFPFFFILKAEESAGIKRRLFRGSETPILR
jgi:hypothetical protein